MNTDRDADEYREKIESFGISWINAWDGNSICEKFGVRSFPTILVLDEDGRVAAMNVRGGQLENVVERVLAEMKERREEGKAQ